jgi:hypothetical protein
MAAVVAVALVACGPSSGQIRQAREARYDAEPEAMFTGVMRAVASVDKLDPEAQGAGVIRTRAKWYEPDGTSARRGTDDESAFVGDGAVLLALQVDVQGEPGDWYVVVTPIAFQHMAGSPQPRELRPDDPQMPGWVQGKIDNMYLAVYERMKAHAVAPATAPAP